jgi:aspartate/methionine/tyrosine aminotransferase
MKPLSQSCVDIPPHGVREIMVRSAEIPHAIHLEVGEPNVDTPLHIRQAAIEAIHGGYTHYTHNLGLVSLREAIVKFLNRSYGLNLEAAQVVVTSGAVTALAVTFLVLVEPGEEVLIPDPSWPDYEQKVLIQGAIPRRYQLKPEYEFLPVVNELEKLVTPKTKAILINSPGNPTGAVFDEDKIKEILAFASRYDLYVISDEVYDLIVYEGKHLCSMSYDTEGRVVSIFGVSKNYAMTGWRIGYAIAPLHIAPIMEKTVEPLISCASSISQKAAEAAYSGPQDFVQQMCEVYRKRRDRAFEIFTKAKVKAFKPKGAFYMLVDLSETGLPPEELSWRLLEEEAVAVAPGNTFGLSCQKMIRISLAAEDAELIEGARRICEFVERFRSN